MSDYTIGRSVVRGDPNLVFVADVRCTLEVFVPSRTLDNQGNNPPVVIQVNAAPTPPYGDERSAIAPYDRGMRIHLEPGQGLWAVSAGESMLVFSSTPVEVSR